MKGKILFVVGLGVGYVLGTRAGRERYEQIRKAAEGVWNQPAVQDGVQTVKDFAMARVGDVSDTVLDNAKKLVRQMSGAEGSSTNGSGSKSASSSTGAKSTASKSAATGSTAAKSSGSSTSTRSSAAKSSGSKTSGSSGSSSSSS